MLTGHSQQLHNRSLPLFYEWVTDEMEKCVYKFYCSSVGNTGQEKKETKYLYKLIHVNVNLRYQLCSIKYTPGWYVYINAAKIIVRDSTA